VGSGSHRVQGQVTMKTGGSGDDHEVRSFIGEEFVEVEICMQRTALSSALQCRRVGVSNPDQLDPIHIVENAEVVPTHRSKADDTNSDRHMLVLPGLQRSALSSVR
jgi:hypothetical protein